MQLLITRSKNLLLAVLSCSLLIAGNSNDFPGWGFTDTHMRSDTNPLDSIWNSLGRELNLDHSDQSWQVQTEIHKLIADQGKLYSILKAAAPYIYFIHKQTQALGLPAEAALIPVIESEFNPNDHSKRGATGLWQLMPATAQQLVI